MSIHEALAVHTGVPTPLGSSKTENSKPWLTPEREVLLSGRSLCRNKDNSAGHEGGSFTRTVAAVVGLVYV